MRYAVISLLLFILPGALSFAGNNDIPVDTCNGDLTDWKFSVRFRGEGTKSPVIAATRREELETSHALSIYEDWSPLIEGMRTYTVYEGGTDRKSATIQSMQIPSSGKHGRALLIYGLDGQLGSSNTQTVLDAFAYLANQLGYDSILISHASERTADGRIVLRSAEGHSKTGNGLEEIESFLRYKMDRQGYDFSDAWLRRQAKAIADAILPQASFHRDPEAYLSQMVAARGNHQSYISPTDDVIEFLNYLSSQGTLRAFADRIVSK